MKPGQKIGLGHDRAPRRTSRRRPFAIGDRTRPIRPDALSSISASTTVPLVAPRPWLVPQRRRASRSRSSARLRWSHPAPGRDPRRRCRARPEGGAGGNGLARHGRCFGSPVERWWTSCGGDREVVWAEIADRKVCSAVFRARSHRYWNPVHLAEIFEALGTAWAIASVGAPTTASRVPSPSSLGSDVGLEWKRGPPRATHREERSRASRDACQAPFPPSRKSAPRQAVRSGHVPARCPTGQHRDRDGHGQRGHGEWGSTTRPSGSRASRRGHRRAAPPRLERAAPAARTSAAGVKTIIGPPRRRPGSRRARRSAGSGARPIRANQRAPAEASRARTCRATEPDDPFGRVAGPVEAALELALGNDEALKRSPTGNSAGSPCVRSGGDVPRQRDHGDEQETAAPGQARNRDQRPPTRSHSRPTAPPAAGRSAPWREGRPPTRRTRRSLTRGPAPPAAPDPQMEARDRNDDAERQRHVRHHEGGGAEEQPRGREDHGRDPRRLAVAGAPIRRERRRETAKRQGSGTLPPIAGVVHLRERETGSSTVTPVADSHA